MKELILNIDPLLFVIFIVFINSTMDKIRTRYNLTIWSILGVDWWFNPSVSWKNKHRWKPTWLFKTVLVWTTDFWHFLKTVMLSLIFIWIIVLDYGEFLIDKFLIYWLFWGLIFEMNYKLKWTWKQH